MPPAHEVEDKLEATRTEGDTFHRKRPKQIIQRNVEDYKQEARRGLYDVEQIFMRPRFISLAILSQAFSGGHTSTASDSA